ncbi:MAG: G5 domain-containing protein [Firmicutes bacterium]|nr:G5 domain-containing protein [Bacillota bacterium]
MKNFNYKKTIIICIFVILITSLMLVTNHIFASGSSKGDAKQNKVETNQNVIDITKILNENKDKVKKQYVYTDEKTIPFTTVHKENNTMTKDEMNVVQQGKKGKQQISVKKTYEGDKLINEETITTGVTESPVEEIIEIGTLDIPAPVIPTEPADQYISGSYAERKAGALSKLGFDMDLRQKSGLSFEDFKKIASDAKDKNNVIASNVETFYFTEQRYNINGVFLMAVAIHESGWGTSQISMDKKNLFGYGSYDSDPYNSSFSFESYAEGIQVISRVFVKYYLNPARNSYF